MDHRGIPIVHPAKKSNTPKRLQQTTPKRENGIAPSFFIPSFKNELSLLEAYDAFSEARSWSRYHTLSDDLRDNVLDLRKSNMFTELGYSRFQRSTYLTIDTDINQDQSELEYFDDSQKLKTSPTEARTPFDEEYLDTIGNSQASIFPAAADSEPTTPAEHIEEMLVEPTPEQTVTPETPLNMQEQKLSEPALASNITINEIRTTNQPTVATLSATKTSTRRSTRHSKRSYKLQPEPVLVPKDPVQLPTPMSTSTPKPTSEPEAVPEAVPEAEPATEPAAKPAAKSAKPAAKPTTKPTTKPVAKPAAKPSPRQTRSFQLPKRLTRHQAKLIEEGGGTPEIVLTELPVPTRRSRVAKPKPIAVVIKKIEQVHAVDITKDQITEDQIAKTINDQITEQIPEDQITEDQTEQIAEDQIEHIAEDQTEQIAEDRIEEIVEVQIKQVAEDKIEQIVEDQIEHIVEYQIENIVEDQIEHIVEDQIDQITEDHIEHIVEVQIKQVVENQIEQIVEDQINPMIEDQTEEITEDQTEQLNEDLDKKVTEDQIEHIAENQTEEHDKLVSYKQRSRAEMTQEELEEEEYFRKIRKQIVEKEAKNIYDKFPGLARYYEITDRVGAGTFSKVYKAKDLLVDYYMPLGQKQRLASALGAEADINYVAIKQIYSFSRPSRIADEIRCLLSLRESDCVTPIICAFRHEGDCFVVLPYIKCDRFEDFFEYMDANDVRSYISQLLTGLKSTHKLGIIHRDVKPANFLYNFGAKQGYLADFGLASKSSVRPPQPEPSCSKKSLNILNNQSGYIKMDPRPPLDAERAGTRGFRPPEILLRHKHQTTAVDIFAVGVILLTILTASYPIFEQVDPADAMIEFGHLFGMKKLEECATYYGRRIRTNIPTIPQEPLDLTKFCLEMNRVNLEDWDPKDLELAIDLTSKCLELIHSERITAGDALLHPFLNVDN